MTSKILYLLPDTNFFIQCRPLRELDWSQWSQFDEVHLLVTRPVQKEIDHQKNRGNDRVGRRARKTHSLFRDVLKHEHNTMPIFEGSPKVRLVIDASVRESPELSEQLDYNDKDEKLVGCVHAFIKIHPEETVQLLTNDIGVMATANMLKLKYVEMDNSWLTPPEKGESEKELLKVKEELLRLKDTEPKFEISCVVNGGHEVEVIEIEQVNYEPLSEQEVIEYVERLKNHFPIATEFGSNERTERTPPAMARFNIKIGKEVFTPASEEVIEKYNSEEYPDWLERCEAILGGLASHLRQKTADPMFCFKIENVGSRPAKDALITFETKGDILIRPPNWRSDEEDEPSSLLLPTPPAPPKGEWAMEFGLSSSKFGQMGRFGLGARSSIDDSFLPNLRTPEVTSLIARQQSTRDPNGFFYKPDRSSVPSEAFQLECEQWRHGNRVGPFAGIIDFDTDKKEIKGAINCKVEAENLSIPARKTVPVRITTTTQSVAKRAESLLEILISESSHN